MCFPLGLDSRKSTYNVVDTGLIPGSGGSPGEGNGNPIQYSCLENFMERRLVGYSSWGHRVRHDRATNTLYFENPSFVRYHQWKSCKSSRSRMMKNEIWR